MTLLREQRLFRRWRQPLGFDSLPLMGRAGSVLPFLSFPVRDATPRSALLFND